MKTYRKETVLRAVSSELKESIREDRPPKPKCVERAGLGGWIKALRDKIKDMYSHSNDIQSYEYSNMYWSGVDFICIGIIFGFGGMGLGFTILFPFMSLVMLKWQWPYLLAGAIDGVVAILCRLLYIAYRNNIAGKIYPKENKSLWNILLNLLGIVFGIVMFIYTSSFTFASLVKYMD